MKKVSRAETVQDVAVSEATKQHAVSLFAASLDTMSQDVPKENLGRK